MSKGLDVRGRALQAGELAAWLSEHSLGNRFGLALATVPGTGQAAALAIVAADGDGRYLDPAALTFDDEAALASWLADPGPPKAVHDVKLAMHALAGRGWALRGVTSDTLLAAHLLQPERRNLGLNELLIQHMRCALPSEAVEQPRFPTPPDGPDQTAVQALILRACAVLDLADVLDEELARIDASSLLGRVELPVSRILAEMETVGIAVDHAALPGLADEEPSAAHWLRAISPDGRIRTTWRQAGTSTGRLTSSDPSLDGARRLRGAVIAGEEHAELMTAGYDALDDRIMAHRNGYPELIEEARSTGYASTLLGRRRYLADLDSNDPQARAQAERDAVTMAIKGSAADIVKLAMINVDQAIRALGLRSRMVLVGDDDLVFEVADGERHTLAAQVSEQMRDAYPLDAELKVSIGFGPTWGTTTL